MTISTEVPLLAGTPAVPTRTSGSGAGSDFARLSRRITDAGLLDRRPGYYTARLAVVIASLAAGWGAFFALGDSWWQLAVAAFLAVVFSQMALVAHDLAHRQVFRRRRPSETWGRLFGNLGIGMSYGWWMNKHTRHHANPNHEQLDPDVVPDILVWSTEQARVSRGLPRFIGGHQASLFFPLLTLEGFNLHLSSVRALRSPAMKHRLLEGALLGAHIAGYLCALFLVLSPGKAVAFLAVHQCLFGVYLGCTFAPNHKGMPTFTGDERPDFLRRQVLTSRNVRGGRLTDVVLGGLNYQIEHHLFPSMPTPHLRRAHVIVRDYCAEIGVPYHETGPIQSYREALTHLHRVGEPIRRQRKASARR
ncbi:fatty acid desaturase family protein [Streptantibioticus cattleyicolor]|uniref:Delta fatty acid desaturase n=1 Tax=Streptantibioticus cattleyicolor (strain ATCC 35852 / DSM 46488 / JCM 4925 / NBRC 14057 / NRRL 8057) TaxID=1003195 RepID=F8JL29_STREN|nr:acyl-CoA desaturase [Streptantibioticus cattleyicolor]AEW98392.1 delta fatty acid desaturase [Streptantibioticus cattleyicolor NRRL 8057 = DSM 46488]CCB72549.1 Delta fatty acid desaturase [Streptantibioticus cattleyicolor NRRL 8057 = DSM 46488]